MAQGSDGDTRRGRGGWWIALWLVVTLPPLTYGAASAVDLWLAIDGRHEAWVDVTRTGAKVLTIVCVPVLLGWAGPLVRRAGGRLLAATGTWSVLAVAAMVAAMATRNRVADAQASASYRRLWPDAPVRPGDEAVIESFGDRYQLVTVISVELAFLLALAVSTPLVMAASRRVGRYACAWTVPVWIGLVLVAYGLVAPWAFVPDADFYIGDAILGASFAELLVGPLPFDAAGAIAVAAGALTVSAMVALWHDPADDLLDDEVASVVATVLRRRRSDERSDTDHEPLRGDPDDDGGSDEGGSDGGGPGDGSADGGRGGVSAAQAVVTAALLDSAMDAGGSGGGGLGSGGQFGP